MLGLDAERHLTPWTTEEKHDKGPRRLWEQLPECRREDPCLRSLAWCLTDGSHQSFVGEKVFLQYAKQKQLPKVESYLHIMYFISFISFLACCFCFLYCVPMVISVRIPPRFIYLNTREWHYLKRLGMALLEEVCPWGCALRFQEPTPGSVSYCCPE